MAVEVIHHRIEIGKSPVVEIGGAEIGIQQARRLEDAAAADVMEQAIGKKRVRAMAARAGFGAHLGIGAIENRLAASGWRIRPCAQQAGRAELLIGEEIDLLHVGRDGIEQAPRRLRPGELVDDDIAGELAQRGDASVASIRRQVAHAPEAGDVDDAMQAIVGARIEEGIDYRQPARPL